MKKSEPRKSRYSSVGSANGFTYMPSVVRSAVSADEPDRERDVALESDLVPALDADGDHEDAWEALGAGRESETDLPLPDLNFEDADHLHVSDAPAPAPSREAKPVVIEGPVMQPISTASQPLGVVATPVKTPVGVLQSLPPAGEAQGRKSVVEKEHPLWALAKMSISLGDKEEALGTLSQLVSQEPTHALARTELVRCAIEVGRLDKVNEYIDHALTQQTQAGRFAETCQLYRAAREKFEALQLGEAGLIAALAAADAIADGALVLEATNLLLKKSSAQIPRALLLTAKHQLLARNDDAALKTLKYLATSYPDDPAAEPARKRLRELGHSA